jgi:hypothetical protein
VPGWSFERERAPPPPEEEPETVEIVNEVTVHRTKQVHIDGEFRLLLSLTTSAGGKRRSSNEK